MMKLVASSFAALLVTIIAASTATTTGVSAARVMSLPGLNGPMPEMYSGYITVDESHGRELFYIFAPAKDPAAPLILWQTGGPGCASSMAAGTENGPFKMNYSAGGRGIYLNPYSWSNAAHTVWLDSPAGVGFSITRNPADYIVGDNRTAADVNTFIRRFLAEKEFAKYRVNPFYLVGESYSGHFTPNAWNAIVEANSRAGSDPVNIKGWMIGNPWTDPVLEGGPKGVTGNWWDHNIISSNTHKDIDRYCSWQDLTHWIINNVTLMAHAPSQKIRRNNPLPHHSVNSSKCYAALYKGSITEFGGVDILEVYGDLCTAGTVPSRFVNWCDSQQITTYFNLPDVQKALNVKFPPSYGWAGCSPVVQYSQPDTLTSVIPIYRKAFALGHRVLVYSGDNDAIVPYTGTRLWVEALNLPVITPFHEWWCDAATFQGCNGRNVAGWSTVYGDNNSQFCFATIRGAGHLAPRSRPVESLLLLQSFIKSGVV